MKRLIAVLFSIAVVFAVGSAQPATPAQREGVKEDGNFGTMHFFTHLGSFRVIDGHGRIEFDFSGTVLISTLKGDYKISGNVHKEYDQHDRVIYTGTGHLIVTGSWRAVHWFGKDLQGTWWGRGMIRFTGEFDRQQKTGQYWYDDPKKIRYWPGGSSIDVPLPDVTAGHNPNVKVKKKGG